MVKRKRRRVLVEESEVARRRQRRNRRRRCETMALLSHAREMAGSGALMALHLGAAAVRWLFVLSYGVSRQKCPSAAHFHLPKAWVCP
jgi:hypothetical protein